MFSPLSNDTKMKIIDSLVAEILLKEHPLSVYWGIEIKKVSLDDSLHTVTAEVVQ